MSVNSGITLRLQFLARVVRKECRHSLPQSTKWLPKSRGGVGHEESGLRNGRHARPRFKHSRAGYSGHPAPFAVAQSYEVTGFPLRGNDEPRHFGLEQVPFSHDPIQYGKRMTEACWGSANPIGGMTRLAARSVPVSGTIIPIMGNKSLGSDLPAPTGLADALDYAALYATLPSAEAALARPINPSLMTSAEWRRKRQEPDSFAARIAAQPRLFVLGSDDDLG